MGANETSPSPLLCDCEPRRTLRPRRKERRYLSPKDPRKPGRAFRRTTLFSPCPPWQEKGKRLPCQTKPKGAGGSRLEDRGTNEANLSRRTGRGVLCTNKANLGEQVGRARGQPNCGFPERHGLPRASCTNKPNWPVAGPCRAKQSQFPGGAGQDGDRGTRARHAVQTNPISESWPAKCPSFHHSSVPIRRRLYKQTQLGAGAGRQPGHRLYKRSQFGAPMSKERCLCERTKPISGGRRPGPVVQTKPIDRGVVTPNEANRRSGGRQPRYPTVTVCYHSPTPVPSLSCETKPMAPERAAREDILAACRPAWGQL